MNIRDSLLNPISCTPLAVVRPTDDCGFESVLEEGEMEDISLWVKRRVKGFEDKILNLLLDIEKNWRSSGTGSSTKRGKSRARCKRELKQLCFNLNSNFSELREGEGRRKKISQLK